MSSTASRRPEIDHSSEVVGDGREDRLGSNARQTSELRFDEPRNRLHPSEDLLDPFALALAPFVSATPDGSTIDQRRDPFLLSNVGNDPFFHQRDLKLSRVVS